MIPIAQVGYRPITSTSGYTAFFSPGSTVPSLPNIGERFGAAGRPALSAKELIRIVRKFGFEVVSGGRHQQKLVRNGITISVPSHGGSLAPGTLRQIAKRLLNEAGVDIYA